ncbi:hypothetical protein PFBG_00190 [Plasmodium falciparum 7G8]|uniref:Uncharacterized protein n=3 Tax=Plasmodium falciparum TaxID=5833 RepID=A0A024WWN4_PLAFA|nr:hypothetical protein PFMALIP_00334 [Plasmodium falciparum MaliPS096_E11]EUR81520.1 hypothetical protein PFBG_00190 [Plasmodium falciparum 7G8]
MNSNDLYEEKQNIQTIFQRKKKINNNNMKNPFEMNINEKKNSIKVYIKNSNQQYDRKILLLKDDKIYFYNSEYSITYDSFYFLMEIKKIYSCDGFFDSLINSEKLSSVNSSYTSTEDNEFYSRKKDTLSSESEWQKCGYDAKIVRK